MANVMSMKKVFNKTSRNGFDLSRKNIFSAKIGELLPVACIECIPGDNFKIETKSFTRTMPVNTAAYTRIREYYDWFFVPTNLMWNKFNTFVTQMGDNKQQASSITSAEGVSTQHPHITTGDITSVLSSQTDQHTNVFGFKRNAMSAKLLEYLGYGHWLNQDGTIKDQVQNNSLNPFPILAYQKIYSDYYRHSQWEDSDPTTFNINYMYGSNVDIPLSSLASSPNRINMLELRYANWNKDYFMGVLPNSQYGDSASVQLSAQGSLNLSLGDTSPYSSTLLIQSGAGQAFEPGQTLTTGQASSDGTRSQIKVGNNTAVTTLSFNNTQLNLLRTSLGLTSSSISGTAALDNTFSILALRNAEAKQKWAEITQSHAQDYKSQIDAHFGVKVSDAYSERSTYIGGQVGTIDISEVVNNNLQNSGAAEIAGKGVGATKDYVDFGTKVHGYLMCIYHAVPMMDYAISGIKKQNLKTMVTDYAIPEFDKTGMVSIPGVELCSQYNYTSALLGYAPRYYDYKTSYDEVHGSFVNGGMDSWVAPITDEYIISYLNNFGSGDLPITNQFFKVNPATMNPIFAQDVDSTTATDQLLVNCSFDIKAVRNLDVDGLPY